MGSGNIVTFKCVEDLLMFESFYLLFLVVAASLDLDVIRSDYISVFQPGFRQFLTGFPENPQISTILSIWFRQILIKHGQPRNRNHHIHTVKPEYAIS